MLHGVEIVKPIKQAFWIYLIYTIVSPHQCSIDLAQIVGGYIYTQVHKFVDDDTFFSSNAVQNHSTLNQLRYTVHI